MADAIPENFRKIRHDNEMTQIEMAEALGVSVPTIKEYESGKTAPSLKVMTKISEYFGIDLRISAKNRHPLTIED